MTQHMFKTPGATTLKQVKDIVSKSGVKPGDPMPGAKLENGRSRSEGDVVAETEVSEDEVVSEEETSEVEETQEVVAEEETVAESPRRGSS